jgi:methionine-gamma-lyase
MKNPEPTFAGENTRAVHAGDHHASARSGTESAVAFSSTFAFENADEARDVVSGTKQGFVYTRWSNPTVRAFEEKVAALEGAESAVALASGMAAIYGAMTSLVAAGDHVLIPEAVYGETVRALTVRLARFGVSFTAVDMTDLAALKGALQPNTKVVWTETPANPTLAITDLEGVVALAHAHGAAVVTDSTFATPVLQRPLSHGVDLVVHSATKAICGHGDAVGGVVAGSAARVRVVADEMVRAAGASMAPMNAFLLSRGAQTMALRVRHSSASALELARRLSADPRIERVYYPGLGSHPGHELAKRQMRGGFGTVLAFEVRGGLAAGKRVHDAVQLITRAVSLGDVRSLVTHAATTTHASVPEAQRKRAGVSDGLLRMSVGIEEVDDLWADLDRALG